MEHSNRRPVCAAARVMGNNSRVARPASNHRSYANAGKFPNARRLWRCFNQWIAESRTTCHSTFADRELTRRSKLVPRGLLCILSDQDSC